MFNVSLVVALFLDGLRCMCFLEYKLRVLHMDIYVSGYFRGKKLHAACMYLHGVLCMSLLGIDMVELIQ